MAVDLDKIGIHHTSWPLTWNYIYFNTDGIKLMAYSNQSFNLWYQLQGKMVKQNLPQNKCIGGLTYYVSFNEVSHTW